MYAQEEGYGQKIFTQEGTCDQQLFLLLVDSHDTARVCEGAKEGIDGSTFVASIACTMLFAGRSKG